MSLYIIYFLNAFLSAIFFTRIRFRIPFDFVLIILVAMILSDIIEYINKKCSQRALNPIEDIIWQLKELLLHRCLLYNILV